MAQAQTKNAPQVQAARIAQMPKEAMKRAAMLSAGGIYSPPYPWDVPPPGHIARHIFGSIAAPNYGIANQVEILNYTVPSGMWLVIKGLLIRYDGSNFNQGSGDVVFQLDINNPNTFGLGGTQGQGRAQTDYGQILTNLGSYDFGPFRIWGSPVFYAGERIGIKGYTVRNVGVGAPNFFNAQILGWEWSLAR